ISWSVLLRVAVGLGTIADPPVFPGVADLWRRRTVPANRAPDSPVTLVAHARRNVCSDPFAAALALPKSTLLCLLGQPGLLTRWRVFPSGPAPEGRRASVLRRCRALLGGAPPGTSRSRGPRKRLDLIAMHGATSG